MRIDNWDYYYMRFAISAAQKSKDPSTQVGACLVKDNSIISLGYNGICRGVFDPNDSGEHQNLESIKKRNERPEKYFWWEHAERNSIYNAVRHGISTLGSTMYCACHLLCCDCARGIIQSGVKEVVYLDLENSPKWEKEAKISETMFYEADIICRSMNKEHYSFGLDILRNGTTINL